MRAWLILTSAALYWLLFMAVHESGHALAAALTGGRVMRVVLHPLALSRKDVSPNPHPLMVAWGGPLWGALAPLMAWGIWQAAALRGSRWVQAFAGFCLVANGLYLAAGVILPAGDTEDILRMGNPAWMLGAVGAPLAIAGIWLWHRLGPGFGTRDLSKDDLRRAVVVSIVALLGVTIAMFVWAITM